LRYKTPDGKFGPADNVTAEHILVATPSPVSALVAMWMQTATRKAPNPATRAMARSPAWQLILCLGCLLVQSREILA
jgi:hypothetical protein